MECNSVEPGQVLKLLDDLGEIPAGFWVVVQVGFMIVLSRAGENEDGILCTTCRLVKITWKELRRFRSMDLTIEPIV